MTSIDDIMQNAFETKLIMDKIILDRDTGKVTGLWTAEDYSIGNGKYEDEDGCLISREEAQDNADSSNRLMAKIQQEKLNDN